MENIRVKPVAIVSREHIAAGQRLQDDMWRRQQRDAETTTHQPKLLVGILGIALGALIVWHCAVVAELQNDLGSALVERDAARGHRDMLLAEEARRMSMHLQPGRN